MRIPPSSAHRSLACPGSVPLCTRYPAVSAKSDDAEAGELAHAFAAAVLADPDLEPHWFIRKGKAKGNHIGVMRRDMADCVKIYTDYVRSLNAPFETELKQRRYGEGVQGVSYTDALATEIMGDWYQAHIIDFKYGVQPVAVEGNVQLLCYALDRFYGPDAVELPEDSLITLTIVQPRCNDESEWVQSTTITDADLSEFKALYDKAISRIRAAVDQTETNGQPDEGFFNPGDHCYRCSGANACPAQISLLIDSLVELKKDIRAAEDPEILGAQIQREAMLANRFKSMKEIANAKLLRGEKVPGLKLVESVPHRRWIEGDPEDVFADMEFVIDYDYHDLVTKKYPTVAAMERAVPKDQRSKLAQFWYKPDPTPVMAAESDARKEYSVIPDNSETQEQLKVFNV